MEGTFLSPSLLPFSFLCLIDFRDGNSKDGGRTIEDGESDPKLRAIIENLASQQPNNLHLRFSLDSSHPFFCFFFFFVSEKINLKKHAVQDELGKRKEIFTGADVEVHSIGGEYYALDFARLMPPSTPNPPSRSPPPPFTSHTTTTIRALFLFFN
jgi:hypothetical protein